MTAIFYCRDTSKIDKTKCLLFWRSLFGTPVGFPGGSAVKNLPASAGDTGSILWLGRPLREVRGNPLQYPCLGDPMDRGASGYSPRGLKESDTT